MTKGRHFIDVCRSIVHELQHCKQNEEGRIGRNISKEGETGSDIENEANAVAGQIMRLYGKKHPKLY